MERARRDVYKRVCLLVAAGAIGGGLALFASLYSILASAQNELTSFASEFLQQDDKVARDIAETLDAGNHSPHPFCSEPDMEFMRELLFKSPYLKDVGRVRDGLFFCSAVAGKLTTPTPFISEKLIKVDGKLVYFGAHLRVAKGHTAEIVSQGTTDAVVSPSVFSDFNRPPMAYTGAILDRNTRQIQQMYTNSSVEMPLHYLLADKIMRKDGVLYYPQCSKTQPDCVLVAMPMDKIWSPHYSSMAGAFAGGSLLGIMLSGVIMVMNRRRRSLGNQLRRALRKKALWVLYQPVVDLDSGSLVGCEALVRWNDENDTPVRPDIFVGIAEELGFVGEITRFVVERVASEIGDLLRANPWFRVSVNLSAMDLADENFIPMLDGILKAKGVAAASVGLELTERSTADRDRTVKVIRELKDRGHVVYIDDFGTGYSSLAYLSELSVDVLKIDQAFTKTIGTDSVTAAIVPQILEMAKALMLKVVVEGVEEQAQADYLEERSSGLQVQGWLFGRPVPSGELRTRVKNEAKLVG
ncbi:sensor c-di-GMP phosphodiesterase, contains CSS-motif sensor and EAL domain [Granulicella pectinivorans]|uniref:cyclic-guanylate-specific phosphodiesterase n=1 Tax=Granulicella pectinivorans TaxID=474950 RepID=A0A1I6MYW7_9BACT|nr:EAL domain-containing protein [Granulicella pectinivorans]SFS20886.1 sensor c-di-GMP phosphodiesterase, contains CSS-motif sensor and EAL domain [Granulicella pectinivorans]